MDNSVPRIDVPALMTAIKSSDEVTAQNAGAMLGYYACNHEEHREAIAAQTENLIMPLAAHLISGKGGLVHNAALLLGQCLWSGTDFRQAFAKYRKGLQALITALGDQDAGVVCNVTWALRHFVADGKCDMDTDLQQLTEQYLPTLLAHQDPRIQRNGLGLSQVLKQRQEHAVSIRRDKSMQAVQALTNIKHDKSGGHEKGALQALEALTALASFLPYSDEESSPTISQTSKTLQTKSPVKSPKASSPNGRSSMLSPWKKNIAIKKFTAVKRNFHDLAAVTQAAAG